ncbi:HU-CCDC81 and SPOR domain-containing protein [Streptomyces caatingaensis]|uniref:REase associating with pPIWI RE domain-containing protein n=1 Tax=Streptomyces caatingaensis TaxID=1678637 RepID=A0A0K9XLK6_9ACTN|nr:HU-CCDC81 and SPOR domain-containing protein [Streptomyces caatingaensis]KNB54210.1 hypothetical protein AC230_03100 [Streptomyces caatingaensis]
MTESSFSHGLLGHPDLRLLRDIATAVVRLEAVDDLDSFRLPYPREAQRALNALVLECLRNDASPPSSLPDLLRWCLSRPVSSWPLELPDDIFSEQDWLIDRESGKPTQFCHELALKGHTDSTAEQYDRLVINEALRACREDGSPESYAAFRRLLVTRPVLTEADWFDVTTDLYLDPVRDLIDEIYDSVPDGHLRDGSYTPCGRCLTLLTPLADGGWWCERDQCRHQGAPPTGIPIDATTAGEVRQLRRPLRQFVTGPGRAETDLEGLLRRLGLAVEMWPGYDAYDLRITFPDGHVWAVDVKDWAHPGLLGRAAEPPACNPHYDEACWVVPRFRVEHRKDYIEVYERERGERARGLRLFTDDQLRDAAAARLQGQHGPAVRIGPPTPEDRRGGGTGHA